MLLLDILIGALLVFPFATDLVWFEVPGFATMELSDLGVPLLAASLIAGAVRRKVHFAAPLLLMAVFAAVFAMENELWSGLVWKLTQGTGAVAVVAAAGAVIRWRTQEPWENSFFLRQTDRVAQGWLSAVRTAPGPTLWSVAAAVGAILFWVAIYRHRAFETHGYDLGIFTNTIWNLTHGNGYVSSVKGGINLLADHQSPLFWVLAPLFWLAPRPETLLAAQAFGLAAGAPALYHLGRARFGADHWAPAALPWLYWCYLPMRNANAFDFHPEVFMLPLFLWAFAGFASERRRSRVLGAVALLAALAAKESAAVVAFGIGVAWALLGATEPRRSSWPGIALAVASVLLFLFDVKVVPRLFGEEYAYLGLYERFGGGLLDVVLAPFTQPGFFFSQVMSYERLSFLFWTLAPLGFLPLLDWRVAVAALPTYLMLFLSEGDQRVRIVFHYGIEPASALFLALPFGLAVFARRFGWRAAGGWMLFWALAAFGPSELSRPRMYAEVPHRGWLAAEALPCLDAYASIAASDVLVPQLATRAWIGYPDQLKEQPSGKPVACVVTDLRVNNWPLGRAGVEKLRSELPERGYREAYTCESFTVHEFTGARCLTCRPKC